MLPQKGLPKCILEWSSEVLRLIRDAKRSELKMQCVPTYRQMTLCEVVDEE